MAKAFDTGMKLDRKMAFWAKDTLDGIRRNFKVQCIFPFEVYPGYAEKNKKVKRGWKSTGAAYDSFVAQIRDASEDKLRMDFLYRYYMNYVDIGVGAGLKAGDVERGGVASNTRRYTKWNHPAGQTHRPAVAMELRHLARRMMRYMARRYEMEGQMAVLKAWGVDAAAPEGTVVITAKSVI